MFPRYTYYLPCIRCGKRVGYHPLKVPFTEERRIECRGCKVTTWLARLLGAMPKKGDTPDV